MAGRIIDVTMQLIDKVTQPLQSVTSSLTESNKQWQRAGKEITNTGRGITKVGQGLTTAITLPVVAAGTAAVNNFAEVDKAMTLIEGTMGKDKFAAADLGKAMEDAAATSVYSMSDAANAALSFARGGWDAAQAANAIAPAMNLAAGAGGDLDVVSAGLMATMNAFGAGAQEAESYADVFANACSNSALDVNSLSEAMSIAAPIFKTGRLDVQDAALAMGVMANNGTDANVAANALKSGLARLAAPAKEGSEWMERLGITAFDSKGKMRSMIDIQNNLNAAFSTLSSQEQEAAASAIFGKNQMASWLGLINTSPASVNELSDALGKQSTASEMAGAMMQGTGGSIESLKSSIDVLSYSFGQLIAQYATPVIQKITEIIDRFRNLDDGTKDMIIRFAGIAAAVGPALLVFGKMVTTIGGVVSAVGKIGGAIKAANGVMAALASPAGIVIAVLAAIGIAIALVVTHWDQVKAAAQSFFNEIQPLIKFLQDQWNELVTSLKSTWESHLKPVWEGFRDAVSDTWTAVRPILLRIAEIAKDVFELKFKFAIEVAVDIFKFMAEFIGATIETVIGVFNGYNEFISGVFTGDWDRAWNGVKDAFSSVMGGLESIASSAVDTVCGILQGIADFVSGLFDSISGLGDKAKEEADKVPSSGSNGHFAVGTSFFRGGTATIHERGAEIVDLPRGTRIYPHSESLKMAYNEGRAVGSGRGVGNISINIPKLADNITVRSSDDIEAIAVALANKLEQTAQNIGGGELGYIY